jgi:uncharacterized protein
MSFLQAEWRKLALLNYEVPPSILKESVPNGTELDLWNGKCYVSVVGFMFQNTEILGLKIPCHINFEEVNLRFYVKRKVNNKWRRGVVFIKEIVPKWVLSFVANSVYNEHYQTCPMKHNWTKEEGVYIVEYQWKIHSQWQSISITAEDKRISIQENSEAEFITEHYWGYAKVSEEKTNEYEVTHPRWMQYPVIDHAIDVDFKLNYGNRFAILNEVQPVSVQLAEGSQITVGSKKTLR